MSLGRAVRLLLVTLPLLGACGNDRDGTQAPPVTCDATRVNECPSPAPTYADVQPIFEQRCSNAACHTGAAGGEWPLDTYSHVADWQDVIRDELLTCAMPPPDSGVVVTRDERQLILTWIRCGYRE